MLLNYHPYVNVFKHAHQILNARWKGNQNDLHVQLHYNEATDARRYNLPTANEIAAVIPGDSTEVLNDNCDFILCLQGGALRCISHLHCAYSTLHYVLLFPKAEHSWHLGMELQQNEGRQNRSKHLTQILYYAYHIHVRPQNIEPRNLFYRARSFQQYVCDAWASVEQSNLTWIVYNQKKKFRQISIVAYKIVLHKISMSIFKTLAEVLFYLHLILAVLLQKSPLWTRAVNRSYSHC